MKLFVCPNCGKPSTTWRFVYKPAIIEGVFVTKNRDIVIQPPLVVRNTMSPEEAITDNRATIICPKCEIETDYTNLDEMTICDIRRTKVPTRPIRTVVQYRPYNSTMPITTSLELDVDVSLDEETILRLLSVD